MTDQTEREELTERLRHYATILRAEMDDPWTARDIEVAARMLDTPAPVDREVPQ